MNRLAMASAGSSGTLKLGDKPGSLIEPGQTLFRCESGEVGVPVSFLELAFP
jgi:hypothetical protein